MHTPCPPTLHQRFHISRRLGEGGMGTVFAGTHPGTGRPCAVKILQTGQSPEARQRFLQEAQVMARLGHPNLIEVLDLGEEDGTPWLAIELVDGMDLGAQPPEVAGDPALVERLALEVGGALETIHREGILHRDVKPNNIMLDRRGRLVLMDLGLARDMDATRFTRTGAMVGTPQYLAPEVLRGREHSPASDFYALGLTMHALLLGRPPVSTEEIMVMLGTGDWHPPAELPGALRGTPLEETIRALVDADPDRRPCTRAELEELLTPAGAGADTDVHAPLSIHSGSMSFSSVAPATTPAPAQPGARIVAPLAALALVASLGWWLWPATAPPDVAPDPAGTSSSALAPPGPTPGEARRGDGSPLAAVCQELGLPSRDPPFLTLMALRAEGYRRQAEEALERLARHPELPRATILRLMYLWRAGRTEEALELSLEVDLHAPFEGYWEGRCLLEAMERRLHHHGPSLVGDEDPRARALIAAVRAFEERLRGGQELWKRALRAEFWDMLTRRCHPGPSWHLGACDLADRLLSALVLHLHELPREIRILLQIPLHRMIAVLGQQTRADRTFELVASEVLAEIVDDATRKAWRDMVLEDGRRDADAESYVMVSDFLRYEHAPLWLPFPPEQPGSCPPDRRVPRVAVPDPHTREPIVLDSRESTPLELREAATLAHAEGRALRPSPGWVERFLLPEVGRKEQPLLDEALSWPDLILPLRAPLEARGQEGRRAFLRLLRSVERRLRGSGLHNPLRRDLYRGSWARFARALLDAELAGDEPRRGLEEARRILGTVAKLPGPWRLDELELVAGVWEALRRQLHPDGSCRELDDELLRVGLRVLEARRDLGRPGSVCPQVTIELLGRILRERRSPEEASECGRGLPEPGRALPPEGLPVPTGSFEERLEALAAR